MTRKTRGAALLALGASAALALSACSASSDATEGSGSGDEKVTLTVWENNTSGEKGPKFWQDAKAAFEKDNPNITIDIQPVTNEDLDGKLQTAMNGGTPPDVFLQRGGGKLAEMVAAGMVLDITADIDAPGIAPATFEADTLDGKIYAMPMTVAPGGIFYSKDLFATAGITDVPKTIEDLNAAVTKLKAAGIAPVALGAKDAWPAAHWFYWFALRECSQETLEKASADADLSDPCFLKAGQDLQAFADTEPFQQGFLTTAAQNAADTADGLMANHQAAMQLMGSWMPGSSGSLTPDGEPLKDLGFFPFPTVDGGKGDPAAMMGGVDAFSCSAKAPKEACVKFLNFLGSKEQQAAFATANSAIPANSEAADVVELPSLKELLGYYDAAPYVSLWLDTRLGQSIGNALNKGVVDMLSDQGTPEGIIEAANSAAAKG